MSITVKDCLKLPSLSLGKVIAGHDGLNNIVTTVSVMEFNDTDDQDILSPNELLISALFCVKDDVDAQCRLIKKARRSGDVGLVLFYSKMILGEISPKFIRMANYLHFPVILMPENDMGLKYSDVISDVTEAIYTDRSAENYFVSDTMQILSQSPEQERTPSMVLKLASSYAKAAFFLCDEREKPIASSFWPAANYMEFAQIKDAYESQEDNDLKVFRRHFRDKKDTELVLYAASQNNKLNSAILGEVTEAVQLFSLLWNYNLNPDTPEAIIPAILRGKSELASYICSRNHMDGKHFNKMILVEGVDSCDFWPSCAFVSEAGRLFSEFESHAVYDVFGRYFVILYQNDSSVKIKLLEESLYDTLNQSEEVSTWTAYSSSKLTEDASEFFSVFCESLPTARKIFPKKKNFSYSDIYFANRAGAAILSLDSQNHYYNELLMPIIKCSEKELMPTLITYLLDCNSEIKATADTLYVHRNTVLYRLNKIRALLGCDLSQMPMAYDIYLAAAIYRIQK